MFNYVCNMFVWYVWLLFLLLFICYSFIHFIICCCLRHSFLCNFSIFKNLIALTYRVVKRFWTQLELNELLSKSSIISFYSFFFLQRLDLMSERGVATMVIALQPMSYCHLSCLVTINITALSIQKDSNSNQP